MILFKKFCDFFYKVSKSSFLELLKIFIQFFFKSCSLLIFSLCICPSLAFGIAGSITDPGFSSERSLEESFFGPLKGSVKMRFSRNLRRGNWEDFFSGMDKENFFDTLLVKTDLNLNYPLAESFPSLKESLVFKDMLLFFTLSYKRPVYDIPPVITKYCYKSYFCFEEVNIGVSNSLPKKYDLESQYSVYFTIPMISISSYDKRKYLGLGASLSTTYPFLSKGGFQIKGISSHFFDTAIYGDLHADEAGSKSNDIFSAFNQVGVRFSYKEKAFIPVTFLYLSHRSALDWDLYFFQLMSLGCSAVWSISKGLQIVAGLSWGGDIFQHEFTSEATDVDLFNADETSVSGGLRYSF